MERLEARTVFDASMFISASTGIQFQSVDNHYDETLRFDQKGRAYHYDGIEDLLNGSNKAPPDTPSLPSSSPPTSLIVPIYHSNASFTKKIYLDFDGQIVSRTAWNNQNYTGSYNTGDIINAPAFSTDGDLTTFNSSELAAIQEVWARVSEDYAPFQLDVTTEFPGAAAFAAGGQAIRVVISTDVDSTTNQTWFPPAGGVAYLGSWYWNDDSPVWAFSNRLGGGFPKYIAEAVSHEVGHAFGLGHDGRTSPSEGYYQGHGANATGWAPIMGVGYYKSLSQWSQGEYSNANNQEDDLDIISQGVGLVIDDHGGNPASATQLIVGSGGAIASSGIIATRSDKDAFRFGTQSGSISLNVSPFDFSTGKANLDAEVSLINAAGTTIATVNSGNALNATVTLNVPKGFYTAVVDGVGKVAASGDEGYTDYGSIGAYVITGNVIQNQSPIAVVDDGNVGFNGSVLIDVLANDTDADLDQLTIQSVGATSIGTAVFEAGKVRYTPPVGYLGQAVFSYVVQDELGATAVGQVVVDVHTVIATRGTFYNGATGASASSGLASDKTPLLPGQSSSFANYTNYSRGLNGLVFDVAGLPSGTTDFQMLSSLRFAQWNGISAGGFTALSSLAVPTVSILENGGIGSSARVKVIFPDNTVQNTWLRVTVLADNTTRLRTNDVFYFGNVIGDVNVDNTASRIRVNANDTLFIRNNQRPLPNTASVTNIYDLNRDGSVNANDTLIVRQNQQPLGIVAPITMPSSAPGAAGRAPTPPPATPGRGVAAPLQLPVTSMSISNGSVGEPKVGLVQTENIGTVVIAQNAVVQSGGSKVAGQDLTAFGNNNSGKTTAENSPELESLDNFFASTWLRF